MAWVGRIPFFPAFFCYSHRFNQGGIELQMNNLISTSEPAPAFIIANEKVDSSKQSVCFLLFFETKPPDRILHTGLEHFLIPAELQDPDKHCVCQKRRSENVETLKFQNVWPGSFSSNVTRTSNVSMVWGQCYRNKSKKHSSQLLFRFSLCSTSFQTPGKWVFSFPPSFRPIPIHSFFLGQC